MKLFIDTNIFLDILLKRTAHKEAVILLNAVSKGFFEAHVLDITLLNIDYVAKKQVKDIRTFLKTLNQTVIVNGADNSTTSLALEIENNDLEDNLQYITAKLLNCKVIISNDKSFYSPDIATYTSKVFVEKFII